MSPANAKPLLKSGVLLAWEMVRCLLLGSIISIIVFIASYATLGSGFSMTNRNVSEVVWLLFLSALFIFLYGVVGHQRGINRMLATLTQAHGSLLFDQTLGRFIDTMESRKPGTMATLAHAPEKLIAAFKTYLHETDMMPRIIKRIALHYVSELGVSVAKGMSTEMVHEGQFNQPAFKNWAIEKMQGCFITSWKNFGLVFVLQVLAAGVAWWLI